MNQHPRKAMILPTDLEFKIPCRFRQGIYFVLILNYRIFFIFTMSLFNFFVSLLRLSRFKTIPDNSPICCIISSIPILSVIILVPGIFRSKALIHSRAFLAAQEFFRSNRVDNRFNITFSEAYKMKCFTV